MNKARKDAGKKEKKYFALLLPRVGRQTNEYTLPRIFASSHLVTNDDRLTPQTEIQLHQLRSRIHIILHLKVYNPTIKLA